MTRRDVERITGLECVEIPTTSRWEKTFALREEGVEIIRATDSHAGKALKRLVELNLRRRSEQVIREQGGRCAICGELRPLEVDHIEPRSKGRNDRRENLHGVCTAFGCGYHRKKHGG